MLASGFSMKKWDRSKAFCAHSLPHGFVKWLRGRDLNPRPLGYEPNELPDCSTPRHLKNPHLNTTTTHELLRDDQ